MLWWLVILLAIAFCCSFVAPDSGLHNSALQALDSSVGVLSRAGVEQSATSRRKRTESVGYEPDAEGTPQHCSVRAAPLGFLYVHMLSSSLVLNRYQNA